MNTDGAGRRAIASRTSRVVDNALNLYAWGAEVDQQAKSGSCCPQVIDALRAMRAVKRPHRFQFNENSVLNQQINEVFADQGTTFPPLPHIFDSMPSAACALRIVERFNDRCPHHFEPAAQKIPTAMPSLSHVLARLRNPSRQSRPISLRVPALIFRRVT